jgi:hypothetical protein
MVRNDRIIFAVTKEEKERIERKAKENGVSVGSYIKQVALNAKIEISCKPLSKKLYNNYINCF